MMIPAVWLEPRARDDESPTQPCLPRMTRNIGALTSTTKPAVRSDRSVRHTDPDGCDSRGRLEIE